MVCFVFRKAYCKSAINVGKLNVFVLRLGTTQRRNKDNWYFEAAQLLLRDIRTLSRK